MALESIMLVKEKRDKSLKGRFCVDGRKHCSTMGKDELASSTVAMDSVFITASIEATKHRDVAVLDLPGTYLSADMDDEEEVLVVRHAPLTELMALTAPRSIANLSLLTTTGPIPVHETPKGLVWPIEVRAALLS